MALDGLMRTPWQRKVLVINTFDEEKIDLSMEVAVDCITRKKFHSRKRISCKTGMNSHRPSPNPWSIKLNDTS